MNVSDNLDKFEAVTSRCTIIIIVWNCWDHLFNCLDALEKQTFSNFQIVIVDNGDATSQQIKRVVYYKNLSYLKSPGNIGFAAGNNLGLEEAKDAEWIVLLNPDTEPKYDWFENMLSAAEKYPEFSMFGSRLLQADNPLLLDGFGDCYHVSGFAWRGGMGLLSAQFSNKPKEIFSPCAAAALYKGSVIRDIGGFDKDFFCYMEDVDLGFRLQLAGHRGLIVPNAEVLHVGSATTGKRSSFYVYYGQRNLVWVYVKNMPGILFWIFLPFHVLLNIAAVLRYAVSGQLGVVLRAKYDAIKALPIIWQKRRIIQNSRRVKLMKILKVLDKRFLPGLGRAINSLWK